MRDHFLRKISNTQKRRVRGWAKHKTRLGLTPKKSGNSNGYERSKERDNGLRKGCLMGKSIRILLTFMAALAVMKAQSVPPWEVKLQDGTKAKLSATNSAKQIAITSNGTTLYSIPTQAIETILYTNESERRSAKTWDYFEKRCCGGTGSHMLGALAAAIAAPTGTVKSHYVEIYWFENGDHVLALEAGKDEYRPLLNWLQQLSGVQWQDVEQERKRAMDRILQSGQHTIQTQLSYLRHGDVYNRSYTIVAADDNDDTQLYLFMGEAKPKNIVGILPAHRTWSMNKCVFDVQVLYGKCHADGCDLQAIMLPTATYWIGVEPADVTSHSHPESDESCNELAKQKDRGGPSLRRSTVDHTPSNVPRPAEPK